MLVTLLRVLKLKLGNNNYDCSLNTLQPYGKYTEWAQGSTLHEVVQGSGGGDLNQICENKTTSMAEKMFGSASYGFSDMLITSEILQVNMFGIFDNSPLNTFIINASQLIPAN